VTWPSLPKRSWILLLATWLIAALLTKTVPESAHEFSRLGTVDSLVERGTYQLDDSIFIGTLDKVFSKGHFYSHQPPLLSTLESPAYWVLHLPTMARCDVPAGRGGDVAELLPDRGKGP